MSRALVCGSLLIALAAPALAGGEAGKELRQSAPATGVREVKVEIPIAEIRVTTSDSGLVEIRGSVRQRYAARDERSWAEAIVASTNVVLEVRGDRAYVRREIGPEADTWKAKRSPAQIRVELIVPRGTAIEVDQSIGELELEGEFGEIDVELKIGEVRARVPKSSVRRLIASARIGEVTTDLGDRTIRKEGLFAGETLYENEGGRSEMRIRIQIGEVDIELD